MIYRSSSPLHIANLVFVRYYLPLYRTDLRVLFWLVLSSLTFVLMPCDLPPFQGFHTQKAWSFVPSAVHCLMNSRLLPCLGFVFLPLLPRQQPGPTILAISESIKTDIDCFFNPVPLNIVHCFSSLKLKKLLPLETRTLPFWRRKPTSLFSCLTYD